MRNFIYGIVFIYFFKLQQINSTDANDLVYHIRAERDEFVLGIQLLNPFHNYTTEKLFIYDFRHIKDDDRIQVIKPSTLNHVDTIIVKLELRKCNANSNFGLHRFGM